LETISFFLVRSCQVDARTFHLDDNPAISLSVHTVARCAKAVENHFSVCRRDVVDRRACARAMPHGFYSFPTTKKKLTPWQLRPR